MSELRAIHGGSADLGLDIGGAAGHVPRHSIQAQVLRAFMSDDGSSRSRILIVEDEPFIALTLEDMLEELGFALAGTVSQVSEALDLIHRQPVDCALLDVNLGTEKIDPVADLLAARSCPFIFTTGYGRSGIPAGHAGRPVLQKPFRMDDLAAILRANLRPGVSGG